MILRRLESTGTITSEPESCRLMLIVVSLMVTAYGEEWPATRQHSDDCRNQAIALIEGVERN